MITVVSNPSADRYEKIVNAAKVLGRSKCRKKVFLEIYKGKKRIKTVDYLVSRTGLSNIRILQEGKRLDAEDIVKQTKVDGKTAYQKIDFYGQNKKKIISLSGDKDKQDKIPTRSNPQTKERIIRVNYPRNMVKIKQIYIDDIDSFGKTRKIRISPQKYLNKLEKDVKEVLKNIWGEKGVFEDWGGETDDLFTTRFKIKGKRLNAAFGLKGRGTKGKLVPKKMGKNGDQIQRLFKSPADVFLIQYIGQIDESILDQMKSIAIAKSVTENKTIYYGIIDVNDTLKILKAYGPK